MARIWESQPNKVHKAWLESILDESSDELNDWEQNFIESIGRRIINGASLTQAQEEKLESIYASKTK